MTDKKKKQLGMNPSTASHRLVKDLLWKFIKETGRCNCYRCGLPMERENYSIEHIIPWIDSDDPIDLFFDMENISFSHLKCNRDAVRRPGPKMESVCGDYAMYQRGCRCELCKAAKAAYVAKSYTTSARREKYRRTGT